MSMLVFSVGSSFTERPIGDVTEPGFELVNKSNGAIWFGLTNGKTIDIPVKRLDSGSGFLARMGRIGSVLTNNLTEGSEIIDINKPTRLFIWLADPGKVNYTEKWWSLGDSVPRISPQPDYVYTFKEGKTLYINWDKDNFIRPQKGPFKGSLMQTDSGFPLKNNVADSNDEIILKYSKKTK